jgi:hypothetical protein
MIVRSACVRTPPVMAMAESGLGIPRGAGQAMNTPYPLRLQLRSLARIRHHAQPPLPDKGGYRGSF